MNIAIIPARGGSKRIPRKNIKEFHGRPLISYSINAAFESECFDLILVSTDDQEIAAVAKRYNAEVPFVRPASISDDFTSTIDVIQHAVKWCIDSGMEVDKVCCIYPTAPLIQPKHLNYGLTCLNSGNWQYAFSVTSYAFPIQRAIQLSEGNKVSMFNPQYQATRSQDLCEAYHDAGQFYWGRAEAFLDGEPFFSEKSTGVIIPRKFVQDIDTPEDWELIEALYSAVIR